MNTYTLAQFIKNVENRKNMNYNDIVVIEFEEINFKKKNNEEELFEYTLNNKKYDVYIILNNNNKFVISVIVSGVEFEIGEVIKITQSPVKYIVNLDCDCKFYNNKK